MRIRWHAWYGEHEMELGFPSDWPVTAVCLADAPEEDPRAISRALRRPIGAPPLRKLARGRRSASIVVEDITRPFPTAEVLPFVLSDLERGGIHSNNIWLTMGLGGHAPMRRQELIKKLGRSVVESYTVYQNQPYENLVNLGTSSRGTPVQISRFFAAGDLKISLGTILPHGLSGFSGGPKTVAIGVGGLDTIDANHRLVWGERSRVGEVEGNACLDDMVEIAEMAGLRFIVNGVVNSRRQIAGIFAGDPVEAHRAGVRFARKVCVTDPPDKADVVVLNAYPKDTDLVQVINAFNAVGRDVRPFLRPGGSVVLVTASPQGAAMHYHDGVAMRGHNPVTRERIGLGRCSLIIFSPNLSYPDVKWYFPEDTKVFNHWEQVREELETRHTKGASVSVFPCAALQFLRRAQMGDQLRELR